MKYSKLAWGIIAIAAGIGLGACGGGGGGGGTTPPGSQNITVGAITGFGSVYVNGCEYETTSTSISVDDNPSVGEDSLKVGQMVKVTSSSACDPVTAKANATGIVYADDTEGVVDNVSITNGVGSMVVMGQFVTVNELTIYEDNTQAGFGSSIPTINDVAPGHIVEVSGYSIGTGSIVATRIEAKFDSFTTATTYDASYELEVKGLVSNDNGSTFTIGSNPGLTISYTTGVVDDSIGTLANDLFVEVKGTTYTSGSGNTASTLVATKVELEDDGEVGHQGEHGAEIEYRGLLTSEYDPSTKKVGIGSQVLLIDDTSSDPTEFVDVSLADLNSSNVGSLILKVNGKYDANGNLVAEKIRREDSLVDTNECTGTMTIVSSGTNSVTIEVATAIPADCDVASPMTAIITNNTIMHDSNIVYPDKYNMSTMKDGDMVEVHVDPNTNEAIRMERK